MEVENANEKFDVAAQPGSRPTAVRMIVINNSQIYSNVLRAASTVLFLALVIQLVLREVPSGTIKEIGKTLDIALIAVSVGLFIMEFFLERALRRCPVCRSRITTETEKKRCCLECNTKLWDYWDE